MMVGLVVGPMAEPMEVGSTAAQQPLTPRQAAAAIARRARCADPEGSYTHLFFSDDPVHVARAKAICSLCTVKDLCLGAALRRQEAYGVWGGELVVDGNIKADIPRRGRPRKIARVAVRVDEVTGTPIVA